MEQAGSGNGGLGTKTGVRRARTFTYGTSIAVVFVVFLVLLSPVSGASAKPAKSVTLKAPYTGTASSFGLWEASGCGYAFGTPVIPSMNVTTGIATASLNTSAKSCGSSNTTLLFGADTGFISGSTFKTTTGAHTVTVHWTLTYSVSLAAKAGKTTQYAFAEVGVEALANLDDLTNSTGFNIGYNESGYYNSTSPTTHTYSYSITLTSSLKLVKNHVYAVEVEVYLEAAVEVSSGKSTASADINMGSSGNEAKLTSIVIP